MLKEEKRRDETRETREPRGDARGTRLESACSSFNSKARDPSSRKDAPQGVLVSICMNSRAPPANQRGPTPTDIPLEGLAPVSGSAQGFGGRAKVGVEVDSSF